MSKTSSIPTLLAIAWVISGTTVCADEPTGIQKSMPIARQVREVVSHLVGAMDTSAQAIANPKAPDVRITTCEVAVQGASGVRSPESFLYQEQAMSRSLAKPYRQRFLRIAPSADSQSVESAVFKPPTPAAWIGLCDRPSVKRVVRMSDLGTSRCSVFLRPFGDRYIGETPRTGCPSDYKGAVKVTNRIILHQTGMDTLDRGFDASGHQLWGAKQTPYQFRWIQPNASPCSNLSVVGCLDRDQSSLPFSRLIQSR